MDAVQRYSHCHREGKTRLSRECQQVGGFDNLPIADRSWRLLGNGQTKVTSSYQAWKNLACFAGYKQVSIQKAHRTGLVPQVLFEHQFTEADTEHFRKTNSRDNCVSFGNERALKLLTLRSALFISLLEACYTSI